MTRCIARPETARLIQQRGDRLFTLKNNRPGLRAEVAAWFADPLSRPELEHRTTDAEHGRIELRRQVVSHDVGWLLSDRRYPGEAAMPGLAMIGMVEATVTRDGKTSTLRRFYLSSTRPDISIRRKRKRSGWSDEFARSVLG